ncbi:MAG TPA: glutamate-5-semialdehyde dehydrogenase [Sulfurimonas sp.]|nr:glutamate-5-semialdehyde dehydrogenase [Sulfurimonas sp.]
MEKFLAEAKASSRIFTSLGGADKNRILHEMADALESNVDQIVEANKLDMIDADKNDLTSALKDRLLLDISRVEAMATSIREISALKEPVGRVLDGWVLDNGIKVEKVSVPIGVIGIIYESRPNVTSDTAALCFKSSNICILKGGKEAENSNKAIAKVLKEVLVQNDLPSSLISLLPDSSREGVAKLIKMDKYVDLIVPRGGEGLISYVCENASVPVVKHDKGQCHTYIGKDADEKMAIEIAINAKTHRPGVCNAMETLLVDESIALELLPKLASAFAKEGTELRGCSKTQSIIKASHAGEKEFHTEYLENILNIRVVKDEDEAIEHIINYGSGHSEAIITENYTIAEKFLNSVDAAAVYLNASTRFTDGGSFGFGAEVGISTNKLHVRGPMGIEGLTTYKFKLYGSGQVRS